MTKIIDHRYAHLLCDKYLTNDQSMVIVVHDNREAKLLENELSLYMDKNKIKYFPDNEILPYDHFSIPENIQKERFQILNSLNSQKEVVITTIKSLFELYPTIDLFKSKEVFKIHDGISLKNLENILISLNYEKTNKIESLNQYAIRGGIIDIFTPIYRNPLRVEIFDDEIESIRYFDIETQLSIEKIENFKLTKSSLYGLDEKNLKLFRDNWRNYFQNNDERHCEIFQKLNKNEKVEGSDIYLPLFFNKTSTFFDLFLEYEFILLKNLDTEISLYDTYIYQRYNDENIDSARPLLKPKDCFVHKDLVMSFCSKDKIVKAKDNYKIPCFKDFESLLRLIDNKEINNKKIILITSIQSEYEKLIKKFSTNINEISNIDNAIDSLNLMFSEIVRPIELNSYVVCHKEYSETVNMSLSSNDQTKSLATNKDILFKEGDYVVHENYGIGLYSGLEVVKTNDTSNEYMKIIYSSNEALYVPLRSVELISKYHKNDFFAEVILDSLSSNKWSKNKAKAEQRAYDHAAEILDIESRRQASTAKVLRVDDFEFNKFNNLFPFTETPDQLDAIKSIRKDMGLVKPMNRVLCGDVGFGKTEVAMRSAFISISSGKQVIILCPSTVLSDQHYESFLERFKSLAVNTQIINRHVNKKNKEGIVSDFNKGNVDILIGTHALFTSGINFSNTGLLVVDEEHKFGIKQKDLIKSKQENIHILYLSATPIPRTMNFIFSGLKEFSFLHTPPTNRISIKSFLKVENFQLFKEAISREVSRGGQCFIVQNDISKMESLKKNLISILPEITIDIAHGKLNKNKISKVMGDFDLGRLDVLICTTIVEMGLDIPNANTILIIDAQNFGLSQLHQLRGRVGRSIKQGYCYFLIPIPDLSRIAKNRLDSIIRLSDLGSGFFIAQEDLEIRGGGEILGDKQSGHINTIGINLYLSMLKNALNKFKNNDEKELIQTEINFYDSSYINDDYLPSPLERLKIYKSLNSASSIDEINKIKNDLIDRCGALTEEIINLISDTKLAINIKNSGILKINSSKIKTSLLLSSNLNKGVFDKILTLVTKEPNIYNINKENKLIINLNESNALNRRNKITNLINEIL
ncbi:transcription-repair coupling factor [Gammaproteobacteria bacterium]|nr:transcription-repair coupling factor [Gammaproteobacteria bacterium]